MILGLLIAAVALGVVNLVFNIVIGNSLIKLLDIASATETPQELVRKLENSPALVEINTPQRV